MAWLSLTAVIVSLLATTPTNGYETVAKQIADGQADIMCEPGSV